MNRSAWKFGAVAGVFALVGLFAGTVQAQEEAAPAPDKGSAFTVNMNLDWVSAYWFRGIASENQGLILQPSATLTINAFEGDGIVKGVNVYFNTWNSLHWGPTGADGAPVFAATDTNSVAFETDLTAGVSVALPMDFTFDFFYTAYTYPGIRAGVDTQELNFKVAYSDAGLWAGTALESHQFAINPYVLLAFSLTSLDPAFRSNPVYLELGIAPSVVVVPSEQYPVTLSVPMVLGLGLNDTYIDRNGSDRGFGFVQIGLAASAPMPFIPSRFGDWTATAGIYMLFLGDGAADFSSGLSPTSTNVTGGADNFQVFTKVGVGLEF